jgi:hypothetical protein
MTSYFTEDKDGASFDVKLKIQMQAQSVSSIRKSEGASQSAAGASSLTKKGVTLQV